MNNLPYEYYILIALILPNRIDILWIVLFFSSIKNACRSTIRRHHDYLSFKLSSNFFNSVKSPQEQQLPLHPPSEEHPEQDPLLCDLIIDLKQIPTRTASSPHKITSPILLPPIIHGDQQNCVLLCRFYSSYHTNLMIRCISLANQHVAQPDQQEDRYDSPAAKCNLSGCEATDLICDQ